MKVLGLIAVAAALSAATASGASARQVTDWYWTPGYCKSTLAKYGVQLDDGRRFYVQQAFCSGRGGTANCEWNQSYTSRLYRRFLVGVRSYDGTVRTMDLYTYGQHDFRAYSIQAYGTMTPAAFWSIIGGASTYSATKENAKGCAPYSP